VWENPLMSWAVPGRLVAFRAFRHATIAQTTLQRSRTAKPSLLWYHKSTLAQQAYMQRSHARCKAWLNVAQLDCPSIHFQEYVQ
jgi:hypothetical protein